MRQAGLRINLVIAFSLSLNSPVVGKFQLGKVVTICDHLQPLLRSESKGEITRETSLVSFDRLIQSFRGYVVKGGEIGVDDDLAVTDREDHGFQRLELFHETLFPMKRTSRIFRSALSRIDDAVGADARILATRPHLH